MAAVPALPLVALGTLLGDRAGPALQAPLSTSLNSTPAPFFTILPPELRVDTAALLLPGAFGCCLRQTFLWDLKFFVPFVGDTVPMCIPVFLLTVTVVGHLGSAPSPCLADLCCVQLFNSSAP